MEHIKLMYIYIFQLKTRTQVYCIHLMIYFIPVLRNELKILFGERVSILYGTEIIVCRCCKRRECWRDITFLRSFPQNYASSILYKYSSYLLMLHLETNSCSYLLHEARYDTASLHVDRVYK